MTVDELAKFAPGFNWKGFLGAAKMETCRAWSSRKKARFRNWRRFTPRRHSRRFAHGTHSTLRKRGSLSIEGLYRCLLRVACKTLSGQKNNKRAGNAPLLTVGGGDFGVGDRFGTFGTMGFGVGQLFSAQVFSARSKAKIQELVANLMAADRARIQKLDWMDDETKEQA